MTGSLAAFLLAFALSVILTNTVRLVASVLGWVDQPDQYRKIHLRPIPRLGGISIYIAFLLPIVLLYFFYPEHVFLARLHDRTRALIGLLLGSSIALGLGITDDFRNLRPATKLFFQIAAGSLAWFFGLSIHIISNPFGAPIVLGWLSFPVTVFWFVACMNAVNLMDGLDGLAAGVCLFITVTLFLVSLHFLNVIGMMLMACLSGAVFGFLLFNFYPAKIFLGDSGTMVLGFLIAALSLIGTTRKAETAIALLIPVVAMGLPILDTSLSIVRRWYKRLPISSPDRQHIHHVLLSMGYSQRRAVLILYSAAVVFGAAALLITIGRSEVTLLVLGSLFLITFVCIRIFGGVRITDLYGRISETQQQKRSAMMARLAVERAVQRMQYAADADRLWEACAEALKDMDLDWAELRFDPSYAGATGNVSWALEPETEKSRPDARPNVWRATLELKDRDRKLGAIELGKYMEAAPPLPEMPALAFVLRSALAIHLGRILDAPAEAATPAQSATP